MTTQDAHQGYVFGNAWQQEDERLSLMERGWDGYSMQNLTALGDLTGQRCLEVGAGGGSIARWLAQQVGPAGAVDATDIDVQLLQRLPAPANLQVRQHNIVTDDLETGAYDLVHTRLVLEHLPERLSVLARLTAALKPDGWLVAEDFDHVTMALATREDATTQGAWDRFMAAFHQLGRQRGLELGYGRRLPGDLAGVGLQQVRADARVQFNHGGSPLSRVLSLSIVRMQEPLVATGAVEAAELDGLVQRLDEPTFVWMSQLMVVAWGRRAG